MPIEAIGIKLSIHSKLWGSSIRNVCNKGIPPPGLKVLIQPTLTTPLFNRSTHKVFCFQRFWVCGISLRATIGVFNHSPWRTIGHSFVSSKARH